MKSPTSRFILTRERRKRKRPVFRLTCGVHCAREFSIKSCIQTPAAGNYTMETLRRANESGPLCVKPWGLACGSGVNPSEKK
jgi:hypothetical protein